MGNLTASLLAQSAEKRNQDQENMEKSQQNTPDTGKKEAPASSNASPQKEAPKLPGAAKMSAIGKAIGSFKEGGTVPKTGKYELHKGEEVVPSGRASEYRKVYLSRKNKS